MDTLLQKRSFIIGVGLGQFIMAANVTALDVHTFEAHTPVNSVAMTESLALTRQLSAVQGVGVPGPTFVSLPS